MWMHLHQHNKSYLNISKYDEKYDQSLRIADRRSAEN